MSFDVNVGGCMLHLLENYCLMWSCISCHRSRHFVQPAYRFIHILRSLNHPFHVLESPLRDRIPHLVNFVLNNFTKIFIPS